jgi:putative transposase
VAHVCRALSITEQTYYRWRNEYGGLKVDQIKRLKDLERENTRLKRAVADPVPRNARHREMLHA